MSVSCNGGNSKTSNVSENFVERVEKSVLCDNISYKDFPLEAGFKGFEKHPVVLLSRHDIAPFSKEEKSHYNDQDRGSDLSIHSERLQLPCVVSVARNDLEKLKTAYKLRNVVFNDSESSDSDPDIDVNMASKCNICEKLYATEKKLLKHQSKKHMIVYENKPQKRVSFSDHVIVHELKEYHKCRKCTKRFENYTSLKCHMKRYHKKRKCYICNYCDKKFIDRMFFKVHIKLHCDVCGQLFHRRVEYLEHKRVCRIFNLRKCETCEMSFFKPMDLKDHNYDHLNVFLVCDVCKDQFVSKCALAHHISFLHSKQRPSSMYVMRNLGTERLYLCNFCDESSVERDLLEYHLRPLPDLTNKAMTGYKDYYFCDQCMKKFDTETNMLQHKWTHFLKTSDNSQTRMKSDVVQNDTQLKTTYKSGDTLPESMNPTVILEKLDIIDSLDGSVTLIDLNSYHMGGKNKKAIVDSKSKKTIISKHLCSICSKYYSSSYCLNRHIATQHMDYENLQCKVCEEIFAWPSLLKAHKCIRFNHPEMPFEDARPEIHFDNIHQITNNGLDDFNIADNDDYLYSVDFDIPAPIVELTEGDDIPNNYNNVNGHVPQLDKSYATPLQSLAYKLVMQEVPIEF